jgi:3-mercaptopyruvate sulfurtransferase SseA
MKTKSIILAMSILILATLACQTLAPQTEPTSVQQPLGNLPPLTEAQVPRITVSDAKAALDSGQAILVDVRSADSYASGHATGSISIPLSNFESNIGNLSLAKDQWIITYCT